MYILIHNIYVMCVYIIYIHMYTHILHVGPVHSVVISGGSGEEGSAKCLLTADACACIDVA